ncbi:DUF924 family protein [Pseudomonas jilinensis]|uniref:DUF924 domain-containing protein n=1 Tax=Pseudomonas jilinensis TaxID=2078689 RepID=A0A396RVR1_9PSED|nr:DUF924 family protein [Pseudomonas jilinensis]PAU86690.1 hypothetical protein CK507_13400 [Pseudomonas sp. WN033]RHW20509.1 DUF924 domain-containing protein [Pseudomonas jilinensis]
MYQTILTFWFEEIKPGQWWKKDPQFDQLVARRFLALHQQAERAELAAWRRTIEGRLAEILVLDQFSRNIWRDTARAFANDAMALVLAQEAVAAGLDQQLPPVQRSFLYMPYMHSESPVIHEQAVRLFTALGQQDSLDYELKHQQIIERFGRYPHRNAILGRPSTAEELAFLQEPGSSF